MLFQFCLYQPVVINGAHTVELISTVFGYEVIHLFQYQYLNMLHVSWDLITVLLEV